MVKTDKEMEEIKKKINLYREKIMEISDLKSPDEVAALTYAILQCAAVFIASLMSSMVRLNESEKKEFINHWIDMFKSEIENRMESAQIFNIKLKDLDLNPEQVVEEFKEHLKKKYGKDFV